MVHAGLSSREGVKATIVEVDARADESIMLLLLMIMVFSPRESQMIWSAASRLYIFRSAAKDSFLFPPPFNLRHYLATETSWLNICEGSANFLDMQRVLGPSAHGSLLAPSSKMLRPFRLQQCISHKHRREFAQRICTQVGTASRSSSPHFHPILYSMSPN